MTSAPEKATPDSSYNALTGRDTLRDVAYWKNAVEERERQRDALKADTTMIPLEA